MSVDYDKSEIQIFADMLYAKAESIIWSTAILCALGGLIIGYFLGSSFGEAGIFLGIVIGISLGGFLGYQIGTQKAYVLKLQAQIALCQVQIEVNTSSTGNIENEKTVIQDKINNITLINKKNNKLSMQESNSDSAFISEKWVCPKCSHENHIAYWTCENCNFIKPKS